MPSMTVSVTSLPAAVASDDSAELLFTAANLTFLEANETTVATSITSVLESTTGAAVNLIGDAFNSSEIPSEITEAATIFNSSEISSDTIGDARTSNSSEIFTVDSEVLISSSNENSGEDSSSATTTDASASSSGETPTESAGSAGLSSTSENTSETAEVDRGSTRSDISDESTRESRMSSSNEISTENSGDAKPSNSSGSLNDAGRELTIDEIDKLLILSAQTPIVPEAFANLTLEGDGSQIDLTSSTLVTLDPEISNSTTEEQVSVESSSVFDVLGDGDVPHNSTTEESVCSDLFFVLDSSGNVLEQYDKQKLYIGNILMQLSDKDRRYGLMTYAGRTRQRINIPPQLKISKELFVKKLLRARFLSGITATGAALRAASELQFVHRTDIIVVTDGFSFDSVNVGAQRLREQARVRVLVTGDYTPVVREVLNSIAGDPLNVFLGGRSTGQLVDLLNC